ncbi:MAG TPA: hypothetical protein VHZ51_06405 [Ktedonobacteraceae bacterium]|nr:hypothetical protein [Ktedonobacteraceae bacterium]
MGEYERSITIHAPMQQVEYFVSNVGNLPKYVSTTKYAMPEQGERVHVHGEAFGHQYDNDGFFKVDKNTHRMEWGADEPEQQYRGWISLQSADQAAPTQVTVHLSFEPPPRMSKNLAAQTGSHGKTIDQDLENALVSIKNMMEGHGGKVEGHRA